MTQLVNTRYSQVLRGKALEPIYLVIFEGIPTHYSTGQVTNPTASTRPIMRSVGGTGGQITVDEGKSSLANLNFGLLDLNGEITRLAFLYQMANRKVTFKAGFAGLDESNYVTTYVGRILNYTLANDNVTWNFDCVTLLKDERKQIFRALTKLTAPATAIDITLTVADTILFPAATAGVLYLKVDDEVISYTGKTATTFTGCLRAQLGTIAAVHAIDAEIANLVLLQGNPLTLALQILTSTGLGTNGIYDVLPACAGLAIPQANINVARFETQRDRWLGSLSFKFEEVPKVEGKAFIEEQLYTFCNSYPITDNNGLISVNVYAPPLPSFISPELNDTETVGPPTFQGNILSLYFFNEVDIRYDFDFLTGEYNTRALYEDSTSQATFSEVKTRKLESRGIRTAVTTVRNVNRFATKFLKRFAIPSPILKVKVFYSRRLMELSDIVPLTSAYVPNLATGSVGITALLMEVIQIDPNYLEGTQQVTLLNTGYSYGHKYGAISPSSKPPISFPVWTLATPVQKNYAFISKKVTNTYGIMSDGSDGFYITP